MGGLSSREETTGDIVLASEALLTWFLIGVGFFLFPSMSFGELASSQVKLPIEVMGADGTTVKVTFRLLQGM